MLNKTRKLYQQITQRRKHSDKEIAQLINDAQAVRNFRKTRVAKLLEDWIEAQRKGQYEYLQMEIGSLNGLNIVKFFGGFLKYVYILQENRGYRKMEAYFDSIEVTGAKYEEQARRRAEANTDK